jgi:hypothetical protein
LLLFFMNKILFTKLKKFLSFKSYDFEFRISNFRRPPSRARMYFVVDAWYILFFYMQNFHVKKIIHHENAFVMHYWWAGHVWPSMSEKNRQNSVLERFFCFVVNRFSDIKVLNLGTFKFKISQCDNILSMMQQRPN